MSHAPTIYVNLEELAELEREIHRCTQQLDTASYLGECYVPTSRAVQEKLEDFSGRWDTRRGELGESLEQVASAISSIRTSFENADTELWKALQNLGEEGGQGGGGGGEQPRERPGWWDTGIGGTNPPRTDGPVERSPAGYDDVMLRHSPGQLRDEFKREYRADNYWATAWEPEGNCTSYVAWRLNDVAEERGLDWEFSNNIYGDTENGRLGWAGAWKDNAEAAGVPTSDTPTAGSVAWFGDNHSSYGGHVAMVRSVDPTTGAIVLEESMYSPTPGKSVFFQTRTVLPGESGYPDSFLEFLPGSES
ncbi:MAG: CHAP domain-containing protein [Acidimicrobiales bacterium]|nr:CHAP domain-containing protein [Acidimicrobiales bacterium]